jgi:hypothetical protein
MHELSLDIFQPPDITGSSYQASDFIALRGKVFGEMTSDKSGSSGNESFQCEFQGIVVVMGLSHRSAAWEMTFSGAVDLNFEQDLKESKM